MSKYSKVFKRSVLPSLRDSPHASEVVRWQFGGVSPGLSPLSSVLSRVSKVEYIQSKVFKGIAICSCQLWPIATLRHQSSSAFSCSLAFIHESAEGEHLLHHITVQSYKRCDRNKKYKVFRHHLQGVFFTGTPQKVLSATKLI